MGRRFGDSRGWDREWMAARAVFEGGDEKGNAGAGREMGDVPAPGDPFAGTSDGVGVDGGDQVDF